MSYLSFMDDVSQASVVLLAHADGDYVDASPYNRTLTPRGSMAFTSGGTFSDQGFLFNGSSRIETPNASEFALPQNSVWSIDARIFIPTSTTLATDNTICALWKTGQTSWYWGLTSAGRLKWFTFNGTTAFFDTFSSALVPRDVVTHVAIWCNGDGNIRVSLDGTVSGSLPDRARASSTAKLVIGATDDPGAYMPNGVVLDEIRICAGTIDYDTGNFTPGGPY